MTLKKQSSEVIFMRKFVENLKNTSDFVNEIRFLL